jgi:nicotinamide riboside kinase
MAFLTGSFIAFCGAGGTGKTTTATKLAEIMPEYRLLTGVSRSVFKAKGVEREADQHAMNDAQRWDLQKAIQEKYLSTYDELEGQPIISDRSHLDQTAYALQYCSTAMADDDLNWIEQAVLKSFKHIRKLFYFPLTTFAGQDDGMREQRNGPRVQFDTLLRGLLEKYDVPFHTVPVMSVEERAGFIRWVRNLA